MKKFLAIFLIISLSCLAPAKEARADFEAIQAVLKIIKSIGDKAKNVIDKVSTEYKKFAAAKTGVQGKIKKAQGIKKAAENRVDSVKNMDVDSIDAIEGDVKKLKKLKAQNIEGITDVNDPEQTKKDVAKHYTAEYGKGNDVDVFKAKEEEKQALLRDNIANLYAVGYVARYNISEDRKENESPEFDDLRQIIDATKDKELNVSRRIARINTMEAIRYEYMMTQKGRMFQSTAEQKDPEDKGASMP